MGRRKTKESKRELKKILKENAKAAKSKPFTFRSSEETNKSECGEMHDRSTYKAKFSHRSL
jgi:hypothetical protein